METLLIFCIKGSNLILTDGGLPLGDGSPLPFGVGHCSFGRSFTPHYHIIFPILLPSPPSSLAFCIWERIGIGIGFIILIVYDSFVSEVSFAQRILCTDLFLPVL